METFCGILTNIYLLEKGWNLRANIVRHGGLSSTRYVDIDQHDHNSQVKEGMEVEYE